MAGRIDTRLKELGIELPTLAVPKIAKVQFYTLAGGLLMLSGQVPQWAGERRFVGKVGLDFSMEQGQEAARLSMLNVLSAARDALAADLDRVEKVMKVTGFVNCTPDFIGISEVVNGASELLIEIFGEAGKHARTAVGVASMPFGVAVEIEAMLLVR